MINREIIVMILAVFVFMGITIVRTHIFVRLSMM